MAAPAFCPPLAGSVIQNYRYVETFQANAPFLELLDYPVLAYSGVVSRSGGVGAYDVGTFLFRLSLASG